MTDRVVVLVPFATRLTLVGLTETVSPGAVGLTDDETATVPAKPVRLPRLITDVPLWPATKPIGGGLLIAKSCTLKLAVADRFDPVEFVPITVTM